MSSANSRSDLSWLQVAAGALAAITSAWIASTLGVAGTLIGAGLGSVIASVSATYYGSGLRRGRNLVTTQHGSVVAQGHEGGDAAGGPGEGDHDSVLSTADDGEQTGRGGGWRGWRRPALTAVAALVVALLGILGYEAVSGGAFGLGHNTPVTDTFRDGPRSTQDSPTDAPSTPAQDDDGGGTQAPGTPAPSAPTATRPAPTTAPTTAAPTRPAPSAPEPRTDEDEGTGAGADAETP